jgi:hypothetical protein
MSFFHYNIAKAIFAINLKGTEYGRSEKSTVLRMILRLLYHYKININFQSKFYFKEKVEFNLKNR